ncbi:MAG: DNA topoisomerase III, partial [Clostridiales bacterium]|nr:DNA topoisomerase III [Clostridiales bacterium]
YYTLTADFSEYTGQWINNTQDKDSKIPIKEKAQELSKRLLKKEGRVFSSSTQEKKELPPLLYDLTSLQRDANRLLGFTAKKTLQVAQSLYETKKAITYPRTDSRYLSKDLIPQVYKTLSLLPEKYRTYLPTVMPEGKLSFSKRIINDEKITDHHAIIPTPKRISIDKLSVDEQKLYELITKGLLAVFFPPYEYLSQEIITQVEGEFFLSRGIVIKPLGWKELYPSPVKKTSSKKEETALPLQKKGDLHQVKATKVKEEKTKPPAFYTDGSLLSAMENAGRTIADEELKEQMKGSGLGTPATRAAIIERLFTVGYAARKGKSITATEKGISLITVVPEELSSPIITGKWELALNQIVKEKEDPSAFMQSIRDFTSTLVNAAQNSVHKDIAFEKEEPRYKKKTTKSKSFPDLPCPVCTIGHVTENQKAFSCSRWKEGCPFTLWKNAFQQKGGPLLTEKIIHLLLTNTQVKGSSGTLSIQGDQLVFSREEDQKTVSVSLSYQPSSSRK